MKNVLFRLAARLESWGKGKQRGRQGLIPFRDQSEISTLLFLGDPAKASTLFWWQPSLFHLRGAVDEGSELTRLQQ